MSKAICSALWGLDACPNPVYAKGLCRSHYLRGQKGYPLNMPKHAKGHRRAVPQGKVNHEALPPWPVPTETPAQQAWDHALTEFLTE